VIGDTINFHINGVARGNQKQWDGTERVEYVIQVARDDAKLDSEHYSSATDILFSGVSSEEEGDDRPESDDGQDRTFYNRLRRLCLEDVRDDEDVAALVAILTGDTPVVGQLWPQTRDPVGLVEIAASFRGLEKAPSRHLFYLTEDVLRYYAVRKEICKFAVELAQPLLRELRRRHLFGPHGVLSYALKFQFNADCLPLPLDLPALASVEDLDMCSAFVENAMATFGPWVVVWSFSWQVHGRLSALLDTIGRTDFDMHPTISIAYSRARESLGCAAVFLDIFGDVVMKLLPAQAPGEEWIQTLAAWPLPWRLSRRLLARVSNEMQVPDEVIALCEPGELIDAFGAGRYDPHRLSANAAAYLAGMGAFVPAPRVVARGG
jgi:hypothetical protein